MKMIFKKIKTLSVGTWLRTLLQFLAYINQFLIILGQSPVGDNPIYIWVSFAITVLITLLSYWYTNDWSKLAQAVNKLFDMVRDGKITEEELDEFIRDHVSKKPADDPTKPKEIEGPDKK